jgi:hypothetical protein
LPEERSRMSYDPVEPYRHTDRVSPAWAAVPCVFI